MTAAPPHHRNVSNSLPRTWTHGGWITKSTSFSGMEERRQPQITPTWVIGLTNNYGFGSVMLSGAHVAPPYQRSVNLTLGNLLVSFKRVCCVAPSSRSIRVLRHNSFQSHFSLLMPFI